MTMPYGLLPTEQYGAQQLAADPVASAAPQQPPRLIDRLKRGTSAALAGVRDRLGIGGQGATDAMFAQYRGLLSPDEIMAMQPRGLELLDPGTPRQQWAGNANAMLEHRTQAQTLQRQQAMLAERDEIGRRFAAPAPNAPHGEQMSYLKSLYGAYAAIGDTEMMGKVGEVLKSIGGEGTQASLQRTEALDADGKPIWEFSHPTTGEVVRRTPREPNETRSTGLTPAQESSERFRTYEMSDRMSREFNQETDRHQVRAEAFSTMKGSESEARLGNAAAQMALIFSYMRLLDPNSAVREGEYHKAEMLTGIPERVRTLFNKLRDGQFLGVGMDEEDWSAVNRFYRSANGLVASSMRDFDNLRTNYTKRARGRGLDPADVVKDYFEQYRASLEGTDRPAGRGAPAATGSNPLMDK